jgi:exodeoxyribonuclease VII small subunit
MAKTTKPDKAEHPSFEKALAELEQIVDKLEKGGPSLNESLALFEKGVRLARFLREELDQAEKKVEVLLKDGKGGMKRKPFKLDERGPREEGSADLGGGGAEDEDGDEDEEDEDPGSSGPGEGDLPF